MKWKLDENFGTRTAHLFLNAGHDAETVLEEQLGGSSDETLAQLRKARGLTQEALVELLGVSQAEVSKMELRSEIYIVTSGSSLRR